MTVMSWAAARATHLMGKRCLWQDLDGLHLTEAPTQAPRTSILWAWSAKPVDTEHQEVVRVRLELDFAGGERVFVASQVGGAGEALAPYAPTDGRVAAFRAAPDSRVDLAQLRLELVAESDPPEGSVPLVFIREARDV